MSGISENPLLLAYPTDKWPLVGVDTEVTFEEVACGEGHSRAPAVTPAADNVEELRCDVAELDMRVEALGLAERDPASFPIANERHWSAVTCVGMRRWWLTKESMSVRPAIGRHRWLKFRLPSSSITRTARKNHKSIANKHSLRARAIRPLSRLHCLTHLQGRWYVGR